ncbi:MAG: hypothetical protein P8170_23140 [Gemmatimonadota bacterium]|jgi:hypothetical protein
MKALTEFLFPPPARRSTGQILRWWEARRLPYNLIVGSAGLLSLGVVTVVSLLPPHPWGMRLAFPWPAVIAFGVLANLCYLLGPAVELTAQKLWRGKVLPLGPSLFRMGLTFSVGLALLPILLVLIGWVYRILFAIF